MLNDMPIKFMVKSVNTENERELLSYLKELRYQTKDIKRFKILFLTEF